MTVTYQVTVLADGERGDNILTNVVTPDVPPYVCDDSDPDCDPFVPPSTEHPVGQLAVDKTVDPESGTSVDAGRVVTYTLSFESVGAAASAVDKVDDLSDVLDDAELVAGSITTSNAALTAELQGTDLVVTGSVGAGETYTVTYSVTVSAFADRRITSLRTSCRIRMDRVVSRTAPIRRTRSVISSSRRPRMRPRACRRAMW